MAYMKLDDYISIGVSEYHNATTWQFAKDKEFTKIIDESIKDKVNVKQWYSMLPKLKEDLAEGETEGYYGDEDEIHGRLKIFVDDIESPWYYIGTLSQKHQKVIITETGMEDTVSDCKKLGWDDKPLHQPRYSPKPYEFEGKTEWIPRLVEGNSTPDDKSTSDKISKELDSSTFEFDYTLKKNRKEVKKEIVEETKEEELVTPPNR